MERTEREKWNERHFQLCLALIARETCDSYGRPHNISFAMISHKADVMVDFLKKREDAQSKTDQN